MPALSREVLNQLIDAHKYPCISIYMLVFPAFPEELQNEPRFGDLLKKAGKELEAGYPTTLITELLDKCRGVVGEREFWNHRHAAMAVFCSPDLIMAVDLPRPVREWAVVADSFQVKPLIAQLQTLDRYQVLCLTRKDVRLYEGDRDALVEVALRNVPRTIEEAYVHEDHQANAPAGRAMATPAAQGAANHVPGLPPTGEIEIERWFRAVDQAVWQNHSRVSHLPLMVCAIAENQRVFRRVSKNEMLADEAIALDPDHVQLTRIREEVWKVMEPKYQERARKAVDLFRAARAHHKGDDDVFQVAHRAADGRIQMLLVEADRQIGGKLDPAKHEVLMGDISDPMLGDLLDDTAQTVLRAGGDVWVMPHEMMPTDTGMAAVYRY